MELEKDIESLKQLQRKRKAYDNACALIYLDSVTTAPKNTAEGRGETLGILSEELYRCFYNPETEALLRGLLARSGELDRQTRREAEELLRDYEQVSRIPMEEYVAYQKLLNHAQSIWHEAKEKSDFALFAPDLKELVAYNRRFAGYYRPDLAPYDALLDQYERGASMQMLDPYFDALRGSLVPLIQGVTDHAERVDDSILHGFFPKVQQEALSDWLMEVMGIDRGHCAIGETEHPFTLNFDRNDVRITTHYFEDNFASSMYSVIHEGGHALYELQIGEELTYSCLGTGVSMGIHESQSRFYENLIGRSEAFCEVLTPKLRELFPEQLAGLTPQALYRAVNRAQPSLIRTEADELTYSLHIMLRYELEKALIDGSLCVDELPAVWNERFHSYFGLEVPDDKRGVLQDSHWSGGSFGYFPSYSLGSAYGAQMYRFLKQDVDVDAAVARGDLAPVNAWLGERIHRHGCLLQPAELMAQFGGFDPKYYTDYLTKKFSALYKL